MPGGDLAAVAIPIAGYRVARKYHVVADSAIGGKFQAAIIATGFLRRWRLTWGPLTAAEKDLWVAFYHDQTGPYSGFTFTDPTDSTSYTVRFDPSEVVEITRRQVNNWNVDAIVLERVA